MTHFHVLSPADLILRDDGSIYHLGLLPEDIAQTILTVGDPNRVAKISKHMDTIQVRKTNREFTLHTGELQGKRLSVLSTGMGTSNIDIVLHELDYLVNIDLDSRMPKADHTTLNIIRLGTTGALDETIPCGAQIVSEYAFASDGLNRFYPDGVTEPPIQKQLAEHPFWSSQCYLTTYSETLYTQLGYQVHKGLNYTAQGFYGPQYRNTRRLHNELDRLKSAPIKLSNIEMETAGIYLLSRHLGHRALSISTVLANRISAVFSSTPDKDVEDMITNVLDHLSRSDLL